MLVTTEWVYREHHPSLPNLNYDKDFRRLNKIATAKKITTSLDQYKLRKEIGD